jgi:alcohol dehydrogenase, propanol-preferring
VFVGLPKDNRIQLPIFETVLNGIHVVGSIVGTRVDLQEVFELHAMGRTRVVHEERNLDEVNDAIEEVEEGEVDARVVFDMGVEEPARQPEDVLTQEAEKPSGQPTGEFGEHKGPMPG